MTFVVPTLTGHSVRLEPLAAPHRDDLRAAAADERIWRHTLTAAHGPGFDAWFDDALAECRDGRRVPFAVRRLSDGLLVGSTSFLDPSERHRRGEIRSTWYLPQVWGGAVNPEGELL